jgi:hypothetical protein
MPISDIDQTAGFKEEAARVLRRRTWTGMSHITAPSFNRTDYMFKVGFQLKINRLGAISQIEDVFDVSKSNTMHSF